MVSVHVTRASHDYALGMLIAASRP